MPPYGAGKGSRSGLCVVGGMWGGGAGPPRGRAGPSIARYHRRRLPTADSYGTTQSRRDARLLVLHPICQLQRRDAVGQKLEVALIVEIVAAEAFRPLPTPAQVAQAVS